MGLLALFADGEPAGLSNGATLGIAGAIAILVAALPSLLQALLKQRADGQTARLATENSVVAALLAEVREARGDAKEARAAFLAAMEHFLADGSVERALCAKERAERDATVESLVNRFLTEIAAFREVVRLDAASTAALAEKIRPARSSGDSAVGGTQGQ
jgi:hypothetical protein